MPLLAQSFSATDPGHWPFVCLLAGMITVIAGITWFRLHAFVALILSAMMVGTIDLLEPGNQASLSQWLLAFENPMSSLGVVAGKIAWLIAMASIIGMCMMESGASERIVSALIHCFGEKRTPWALMASGFILGIPVFFDTVFFLLIPLARGLAIRTGKGYTASIMAISSGAVITHTLVPPTPGPLFMAETLDIPLATGIWAGLLSGLPVVIAALSAGCFLNRHQRIHVPQDLASEARSQAMGDGGTLPNLIWSLLPVLLPVLLIGSSTFSGLSKNPESEPMGWMAWLTFLGNKQVAMTLSAACAVHLLMHERKMGLEALGKRMAPALETAAIIILITAAGGAFGGTIQAAGIGEAISHLSSRLGMPLILVAWITAALMKTAQGSGTVSMITTTGIMASVLQGSPALSFHPIYLYLSIGFGSGMISWMNDSGFWVVCKLSGMSERETLKTWSLCLALIALMGLCLTLAAASLWPMV